MSAMLTAILPRVKRHDTAAECLDKGFQRRLRPEVEIDVQELSRRPGRFELLLQMQVVRALHPLLLPGIPSSPALRRIGSTRLGKDHRDAVANLKGSLDPRQVRVLAKAADVQPGFFARLPETMRSLGRRPSQLDPVDDSREDTVASDSSTA